jgi:hypothetical protein
MTQDLTAHFTTPGNAFNPIIEYAILNRLKAVASKPPFIT